MTQFDLRLQHLLFILLFSILSSAARAGTPCPNQPEGGAVVANPNRPTVSDPADITQFGVLETEYGYGRTWVGGGRQNDFSGLLKFALLCDLELRWTTDSYIDNTGPGGNAEGVGDNWVGAQYRIYHQSRHFPTLALRYEAKLPTASFAKGLGSGAPDHSFAFLASKDISKYHFDFNAGYLLSANTPSASAPLPASCTLLSSAPA